MPSRPILVPIDFSACSEAALLWALSLADRLGQRMVVLHVVHEPGDEPGFYRRVDEAGLPTLEEMGRRIFEDYLEETRARHPALAAAKPRTELVVGLPAPRILEVAEACDANHIVMGSLGRTGLAHLLLGSVAQRVVQLAPVPVTIVKSPPAKDLD